MFARCSTVVLILALTLACSSPPEKEREQAVHALNAARTPDALTYAAGELAAAEAALAAYDRAVTERDYRQALSRALEAREKATGATRVAVERKAAAKIEVARVLTETETLVASMRTRANATGANRLPPATLKQFREDLRSTPPILRQARALIDQQNYAAALTLLNSTLQKLRQTEKLPGGRVGK